MPSTSNDKFISLCESVGDLDQAAMASATARQGRLTKPAGSMGRMEDVSIQLAGIRAQELPDVDPIAVFVFAADHGVARAYPVSAFPPEVTAQMVANYARGGAVVNVLARQLGAKVFVADVGVAGEIPVLDGVLRLAVGPGTADWTVGPAMSREDALKAIFAGVEVVKQAGPIGLACIGEMGIGNTTTSSALLCAFTTCTPAVAVGHGTGVDNAGIGLKQEVVTKGLKHHEATVKSGDALEILAALGGFEIAAIAGAIIALAASRTPILVDGFITSVAALVAVKLCPKVQPFLVASHKSAEIGHALALDALGLSPLVELRLRLGEGSGAVLIAPLLRSACAVLRETATFDEAGVSDKE